MVSDAVSDFRLGIRWKFGWKKWCSRPESNRDLPFRKSKLIVANDSKTGWTLGDRGTETAQRLAAQLPHAAHLKFATDFWHPYAKIFCGENHVQGKAHTFTIESLNNRIRCHLARLKRRTHNHSKSRENLAASILFFIVNKCGGKLVPQIQSIPV
jgi:insertion element IS1 protein InsB